MVQCGLRLVAIAEELRAEDRHRRRRCRQMETDSLEEETEEETEEEEDEDEEEVAAFPFNEQTRRANSLSSHLLLFLSCMKEERSSSLFFRSFPSFLPPLFSQFIRLASL